MTSDIRIGDFRNIKPNSVKWKCSVGNFTDTCTIKLPLRVYAKNSMQDGYVAKDAAVEAKIQAMPDSQRTVFKEGDPVDISLGYNGICTTRFMGFIKQINFSKPLELECEGYSYQLRNKIVNKTYTSTTVKQILTDLIAGTDIKISSYVPHIPLENVVFKNTLGLKVLEWFQKECLLTVYFDYNEIYVGASQYGIKKPTIKLRLGWNTVKENELKRDANEPEIQINIIEKNPKGEVKRTKSEQRKHSAVKEIKVRHGLPDNVLKEIAKEKQMFENFKGYRGDVTCFLFPHADKGFVADVKDETFPDRNGKYFVESVDGSFDSSGGRQILTLRYYGKID